MNKQYTYAVDLIVTTLSTRGFQCIAWCMCYHFRNLWKFIIWKEHFPGVYCLILITCHIMIIQSSAGSKQRWIGRQLQGLKLEAFTPDWIELNLIGIDFQKWRHEKRERARKSFTIESQRTSSSTIIYTQKQWNWISFYKY